MPRQLKLAFSLPNTLLLCLGLLAAGHALGAGPNTVDAAPTPTRIDWSILGDGDGAVLTVAVPDGRVLRSVARAGESLAFVPSTLDTLPGGALPDGHYDWQLVVTPALTDAERHMLESARSLPGSVPAVQGEVTSGTFSLVGGQVVWDEDRVEPSTSPGSLGDRKSADGASTKQLIPDNLFVQGEACIGTDCVNGEAFGIDTLRVKEGNVRVHFDDTTTSSMFPQNDWRLLGNDSFFGGGEFWALEDATAGDQTMRVTAGAGPNALYVDSAGDVGLGTATPVLELHIADGDTPGVRLEQDTSAGLTAQTWDLAGDEASLFVRDVTNASTRPLQIEAGVEDDSVVVTDGRIGLFTDKPTAALHLRRNDETAKILVEETNGTVSTGGSPRTLLQLTNNGKLDFRLSDTNSGNTWKLENDPNGLNISLDGSGAIEFALQNNGDLTIDGTLTENSDMARKDDFQAIDPSQILAKIVELPITTWSYLDDPSNARHIGPMAQDFFGMFGFGGTATGIQPRNMSSVALAAIQGLHAELEAKERRIQELEAKEKRLEELEKRLLALETHSNQ